MIYLFLIYFINLFLGLSLLFKTSKRLQDLIYLLISCLIFPFFTPIFCLMLFYDSVTKRILQKRQGFADSNVCSTAKTLAYLTDSHVFFDDLLKEIRQAKKYVHIAFFTFKTDQMGLPLIHLLEEKLQENVEVKILYDPLGSFKMKKSVFKTFKKQGGKLIPYVKLFYFPFIMNMNYRFHRKLVIIDGEIAYIGGFNIGKKYIGLNRKLGKWVDSELKLSGPVVNTFEQRFLTDYMSCQKIPLNAEEYLVPNPTPGTIPIRVRSSGEDIEAYNGIEQELIKHIYNAKKSILIQTPYLILNDTWIQAFQYALSNGVHIKIMLPNKNDHPFVLQASKSYAKDLMSENLQIFLYPKTGFLHSKVVIFDENCASIGTTNLDIRSFKYDLEINVFLEHVESIQMIKNTFNNQLKDCIPLFNKKQTLSEYFARLFSPIL